MPTDIPFSTFCGNVQQMETAFQFPVLAEFFQACFSAFAGLDRARAAMLEDGMKWIITAAGTEYNFGYRPRRFSGGPGLPPGRYFTVCDPDSFNDHGTLRDELTAYFRGTAGVTASILDPRVELWLTDMLKQQGVLDEASAASPFYLITYDVHRRTEQNTRLIDEHNCEPGQRAAMTYGVRQHQAEIANVIDLRLPETQDWFTHTFVELEIAGKASAVARNKVRFLSQPAEIDSFADLLPVILGLDTGGGITFTQAIGLWLRQHHANGLIFPSARSNPSCQVENGLALAWRGWNLVLYADAEDCRTENLFGFMSTWRDPDHDHIHVDFTKSGPQRGSFRVRGAREFNLVRYDLERQYAREIRTFNEAMQISGVINEYCSRVTNSFLHHERDQGRLFTHDVEYLDFIDQLEQRWPQQPA